MSYFYFEYTYPIFSILPMEMTVLFQTESQYICQISVVYAHKGVLTILSFLPLRGVSVFVPTPSATIFVTL